MWVLRRTSFLIAVLMLALTPGFAAAQSQEQSPKAAVPKARVVKLTSSDGQGDGARADAFRAVMMHNEMVVCPLLEAEFGCSCYFEGFKAPCSFVANCLEIGFCEPAEVKINEILGTMPAGATITLSVEEDAAGAKKWTCHGDDNCQMMAQSCVEEGGTGQCGGDNNPDGCECTFD